MEQNGQEPEPCPICLEDFEDGQELRILQCKHEYHVTCIDQWLTTRKRYCPLCKRDACPNSGASENSPLIIQSSYSGETSSATPNSNSNSNSNSNPSANSNSDANTNRGINKKKND